MLKNNKYGFREIIRTRQFLIDLKRYLNNKHIICNRKDEFYSINELIEETDFFFTISKTTYRNNNNTLQGTFGPIDL